MLGAGAILGPGLGLGGAAVAGLAVASILTSGSGGGAGGGSGGGEIDKAPATVNDPDTVVTIGGDGTTEEDETVTITGTGAPGASVSVEVNGQTETGTVDPDGNWTVTFEKETYPGEGNHEVDVTVTDPDGELTELKGPDIVIDTTPPDLDFSSGVVETNDAHNETEHSSGVTLTGVGEAVSSLVVTIDGTSHSTTFDENGNWSVTFDKSELATGEYTTSATFLTTDGFGNSATYTADVEIDTRVDAAIDSNLSGGDDIVSAAEHATAVAISGTADPNAAISLSINGNTYTITTDASGNWTVDVPRGKLPTVEVDVPMTVTATDPAGNETTANIRPGQEATIKLSAYDYTIFGTLKGRVDVISADTFKDERTRAEDGNAHYKVRVRVDMGGLTDKQARIEIRPGMQAQVELHTGEKTVLQYLLKPLYKSREAFREP
jgi:hypothetical protein